MAILPVLPLRAMLLHPCQLLSGGLPLPGMQRKTPLRLHLHLHLHLRLRLMIIALLQQLLLLLLLLKMMVVLLLRKG